MIRILNLLLALGVMLAGLPGCGSDKGRATMPKEEIQPIGNPTAAGAGGGDPAKPAQPRETAK